MGIEILHVPDCPNLAGARTRVDDALRDAGLSALVEEVEVLSLDDARRLGMHGSPTILIDGHDPFVSETEPSLACRLYRGGGGAQGSPTVAQLVDVLSR